MILIASFTNFSVSLIEMLEKMPVSCMYWFSISVYNARKRDNIIKITNSEKKSGVGPKF